MASTVPNTNQSSKEKNPILPHSTVLPSIDYPHVIRGSLRLMLQLKDAFLACFNLVEEYRSQLLACKQSFARDLVIYQLTQGLFGINRLRDDLSEVEHRAVGYERRNTALRRFIVGKYREQLIKTVSDFVSRPSASDATGAGKDDFVASKCHAPIGSIGLPPPVSAPNSVDAALHGGFAHHISNTIDIDAIEVPEEINLAEVTTASGHRLIPVVDFYRSFYFLQMHFQLIMCQSANFAMPVVTNPMTVRERAFAWPKLPKFGLDECSSGGSMRDRLLTIYTDLHVLAQRLHDCVELARAKIDRDKIIEAFYLQHSAGQDSVRRNVLRSLQAQRVYMDCLESQNDRLAGIAVKLDPTFAHTNDFNLMTGPSGPFQVTSNQNSTVASKVVDDPSSRSSREKSLTGTNRLVKSEASNVTSHKSIDNRPVEEVMPEQFTLASVSVFEDDKQVTPIPEVEVASSASHSLSPTSNAISGRQLDKSKSESKGQSIVQPVEVNELSSDPDTDLNDDKQVTPIPEVKVASSASHSLSPKSNAISGRQLDKSKSESKGQSFVQPVEVNELSSDPDTDLNDDANMDESQHTDENASASGAGRPPKWLYRQKQAKNTTGHDADEFQRFSKSADEQPPMSKLNIPQGHPGVEDLLLGVDSIAPGKPHLFVSPKLDPKSEVKSKIEPEDSPKSKRSTRHCAPVEGETDDQLTKSNHANLNTPTTVFSRADSMLSTTEVPVEPHTLTTNTTLAHRTQSFSDLSQASTSTISKPLQQSSTNMHNATKWSGTTYHKSSKIHASGPGDPSLKSIETGSPSLSMFTFSSAGCVDSNINAASSQNRNQIDSSLDGAIRRGQPVSVVESTKCSKLGCASNWPLGKSRKVNDLLEEPKRSAVCRALTSHRLKLVETILQADEERLEDLISLLMNKSG